MVSEERWTCLRKNRYRTRKHARDVARRRQAEFGRMVAYRCPFGTPHHYHVGHPPRRLDTAAMLDPVTADDE